MEELLEDLKESLYAFVRRHSDNWNSGEILTIMLDVLTEHLTDEEYEKMKQEVIKRVKEEYEGE